MSVEPGRTINYKELSEILQRAAKYGGMTQEAWLIFMGRVSYAVEWGNLTAKEADQLLGSVYLSAGNPSMRCFLYLGYFRLWSCLVFHARANNHTARSNAFSHRVKQRFLDLRE